jgi:hypothetical protein
MLQSKTPKTLTPLDPQACLQLADALGEAPRTALSYNALRNGQCVAFASGQPEPFAAAPSAAVIELSSLPGEPAAYASDANALWALLQQLEGWHCVCAETNLAHALGQLMQAAGQPIRYYQDIAYTLRQFTPHSHPAVRLLTVQDLPILLAAQSLSGLRGRIKSLANLGV